MEAEKLAVPNLVGGTGVYLRPGATYALLPSDWLRAWRSYLSAPSRRPGPSTSIGGDPASTEPKEPGPLITALACMFCYGHDHEQSLLNFRPPAVTKRCDLWLAFVLTQKVFMTTRYRDYNGLRTFCLGLMGMA